MKINELLPQEDDFTEVLTTIALVPKMLFYYGKMPQNSVLLPQNRTKLVAELDKKCSKTGQKSAKNGLKSPQNDDVELEKSAKYGENAVRNGPERAELAKNGLRGPGEAENATVKLGEPSGPSGTENGPPEALNEALPEKNSLKGLRGDVTLEEVKRILAARPKTVAIVGARKYTSYGSDVAYKLAYDLAKQGVVVVSGLAIGIDSIAHRGALDAGGCTVAVLGTAIDNIYPRRHIGLARKIVESGGCVMSEYGKGVPTYGSSFLERNRLISALADVVVVVEATDHSGSLNTAMHAIEQGRDVFAVPGDIHRVTSVGCNRLIMQGAMPYTCLEDILSVLFPSRREQKVRQLPLFGDNFDETAVLRALYNGLRDGEEIAEGAEMEVGKFNQVVAMLEIKGRVRRLGANQWTLV